jgi:hypothetical protein
MLSTAGSPLGPLPGTLADTGANDSLEVTGLVQSVAEQSVAERAEVALYQFVNDGSTADRSGQPTSLTNETCFALFQATRAVLPALKSQNAAGVKAAGLGVLTTAFLFVIADHLGCASMLGRHMSDALANVGKNVANGLNRGHEFFPSCTRAALELVCSTPAAATPAAAGAAAAASPSSAASPRTPVQERAVSLPVGDGYEVVIKLTADTARLTKQRDAGEATIALLEVELAEEKLQRVLAEKGEAAERKRAEASEGAANKTAKAAIKVVRQVPPPPPARYPHVGTRATPTLIFPSPPDSARRPARRAGVRQGDRIVDAAGGHRKLGAGAAWPRDRRRAQRKPQARDSACQTRGRARGRARY